MNWRSRLVVAGAALAMLAGAGPAFGRLGEDLDVHFDAKVKPVHGGDRYQFSGRVRSNFEECQSGRKVRVTIARHLVGRAVTDEDGEFSLIGDPVESGTSVKFKLKRNRPDCPAQTIFVQV